MPLIALPRATLRKIDKELEHYWDLPAPIEEFLLSRHYLGLEGDISPGVFNFLCEAFGERRYNYCVLSCGFGWGKTFAISCALAYMVHCALCLREPQKYYGLADGSEIAFVIFSITYENAKKVLFGEVKARIDAAPWFQQRRVRRNERITSELVWPQTNIWIAPAGSDNTKALGHNILGAAIDEAAWLPEITDSRRMPGLTEQGRYDAAETIFHAISNRILSRGNQRWKRDAMIFMLSQPRYPHDFLQRKLREREWNPRLLGLEAPTWEGRQARYLSGKTFYDPVCGEVPIEYREAFLRNPKVARRDLGGRATEGAGTFFPNKEALAATQDDSLRNCFIGARLAPDVEFRDGVIRYAHIDLGLRRDACGICVCHAERDGYIIVDGVTRLTAAMFPEGEISFAYVRGLIEQLHERGCYFGLVTYDGWQSIESQQQLRRYGIPCETLSVDRDTRAYDTLLEFLPRLRMPRFEWFVNEAGELDLRDGRKVEHPPGGSKDVADAVAGAVFNAVTRSGLGMGERVYDIIRRVEAQAEQPPSAAGAPADERLDIETGARVSVEQLVRRRMPRHPNELLPTQPPDVAEVYPWARRFRSKPRGDDIAPSQIVD